MTEAENANYRNIFYRRGSTLPEWADPNSTCNDLMFNLSAYDDMPDYNALANRLRRPLARPRCCSAKNVSPKRFEQSRKKAKAARAAKRRNRKR